MASIGPWELIILSIIILLVALSLYIKSKNKNIIIDDGPEQGNRPDIIYEEEKPWRELEEFEDGMIVQFTHKLEHDVDCPYCQAPLYLPDPYIGDHRGWICKKCGRPHHFTCRKKAKQCCSINCFKTK